MDRPALDRLLRLQDDIVSREQLRGLGAAPHDVRRLLRRRDLVVVHPGVYVAHTGPPTRAQREWAAVLTHWPAALARESVLPGAPPDGPVHVAIDHRRNAVAVPGVVVHRTADLEARVRWNRSPPRVRLEHAAIDVAASRVGPVERFRVLADVVASRHTTAEALATVLRARRGVPGRALLLDLLADLGHGASSVLEREYLELARRHGLPECSEEVQRQVASGSRGSRVYRDVVYRAFGLVVELDGWTHHTSSRDRDRDAWRDLETHADGSVTLRLTWAMVVGEGCRTVVHVATVLRRRGWDGTTTRCPDCPGVGA